MRSQLLGELVGVTVPLRPPLALGVGVPVPGAVGLLDGQFGSKRPSTRLQPLGGLGEAFGVVVGL